MILRLYGPLEAWFDKTWKPARPSWLRSVLINFGYPERGVNLK